MDVDHCETGNRVSLPVGNCEHRDGNTRNYSGLERSSSQQAEAFHDAKDKTCVDSSINPADRLSKRKRSDEDNSDLSTPGIDKTRLSPRVEINQKGKESPLPEHSVKRQKSDVLGTGATKKNFTPLNISATDNRLHRLTVLLWQKIFCFVPPVFLGRLLRVDHAFHDILKSSRSYIAQAPLQSFNALHDQKSESIWIASRKRFAPGLPRPLFGQSELEMWKLIRGNRCQVCGERKSLLTTSMVSSPWRAGPGLVGVRVVWPFGIRCCGPCLLGSSEQVGPSISYMSCSNHNLGSLFALLEHISFFPFGRFTLCLYHPISGLRCSCEHSKYGSSNGCSDGQVLLQTSHSADQAPFRGSQTSWTWVS